MRAAGALVVLTGLTVASAAFATPPPGVGARYNRVANSDYDYAPVTHVEPIVRQVRIETPRRECWDDVRYVETRRGLSDPDVGARALVGGIIGGVVGHQFGRGRGRDAATVAGALVGASVGADAARRQAPANVEERVVQRCEVRYESEYEERIDGYRVTYEYNGREYTTRLPYDPGDKMRVRVAVAPAE